MSKAVHFVGFKDERFNNARKVWQPDFIHRFWDNRAKAEIAEGDVVIFAEGNATNPSTLPVNPYTYDDSRYF